MKKKEKKEPERKNKGVVCPLFETNMKLNEKEGKERT